MIKKLPYYMVYQEPFGVDDVRKAREDYDYMKSIYPDAAKRLVPFVEEECDRLMYDGSMIYDEYPDQLQLRLMCKRVYDRAKEGEEKTYRYIRTKVLRKKRRRLPHAARLTSGKNYSG